MSLLGVALNLMRSAEHDPPKGSRAYARTMEAAGDRLNRGDVYGAQRLVKQCHECAWSLTGDASTERDILDVLSSLSVEE